MNDFLIFINYQWIWFYSINERKKTDRKSRVCVFSTIYIISLYPTPMDFLDIILNFKKVIELYFHGFAFVLGSYLKKH